MTENLSEPKIFNCPYELWSSTDTRKLLTNRHICFIGDSIQRMAYKDFIALLNSDLPVPLRELRDNCENSFYGDNLITCSELHNGCSFYEIREYISSHTNHSIRVTFFFLTRIYSKFVEEIIINTFKNKETPETRPDAYVVNCTLWDIGRYGANSVDRFFINLPKFFEEITKLEVIEKPDDMKLQRDIVNDDLEVGSNYSDKIKEKIKHNLKKTVKPAIIWRSCLPVNAEVEIQQRGVFNIPKQELAHQNSSFRLDLPRANNFTYQTCKEYNNVHYLDYHDNFTKLMDKNQLKDGTHWNEVVHRCLTFITLSRLRAIFQKPRTGSCIGKDYQFVPPILSAQDRVKEDITANLQKLKENKKLLAEEDLENARDMNGQIIFNVESVDDVSEFDFR